MSESITPEGKKGSVLEDFLGVIFGKDLVYRFDKGWVGHPEEFKDAVVKRSKDQFIDLVKSTYRVLLSRGMKGCYVYFMDKETEKYFQSRIETYALYRDSEILK